MINEQIRTQELNKLFGGNVIPDIGKANSGGDSAGSAKGTKERCLAHTITTATFQDITGPVMFGKVKRVIGGVPNPIPNIIVQFNSTFDRIFAPTYRLFCMINDRCVVTVDNGSWCKVFVIHSIFPFSVKDNSNASISGKRIVCKRIL
jgi:hypothetical protein